MDVSFIFHFQTTHTARSRNGVSCEHGMPVTSILKPNSLQNTLKYVVQQMIKKQHTNESQPKLVERGKTEKRERSSSIRGQNCTLSMNEIPFDVW